MKTILSSLLLLPFIAAAQTSEPPYQTFKKLINSQDTMGMRLHIKDWKLKDNNNPELYVAMFNYHFFMSKYSVLNIGAKNAPEGFRILDEKGNPAGMIAEETRYDSSEIRTAMNCIDTGIRKFPDRLDMRFGKTYVWQQAEEYDSMVNSIIHVLNHSLRNQNKWFWKGNEKLTEPKDFMLSTIQTYMRELYETNDDSLLRYIIKIGEATLLKYPDAVEIASTTAVSYSLLKNNSRAIALLLNAHDKAPDDVIIMMNLAEIYSRQNDKENALKFYQMVQKYGDAGQKAYAGEKITELKK